MNSRVFPESHTGSSPVSPFQERFYSPKLQAVTCGLNFLAQSKTKGEPTVSSCVLGLGQSLEPKVEGYTLTLSHPLWTQALGWPLWK